MAVLKCKMCGANLPLIQGSTVATCEYCSTTQTVPSLDDEKKLSLFERANRLRSSCEFDKAAGIYESIITDFPEEPEAYWGLVLCKYGIEYVNDPATGRKVPTCHRSSFDSIREDENLGLALENASPNARKLYQEEAKQIDQLRKGIIEVSSKEAPYDIFICYKETDGKGERTLDSVLAQDVYDALVSKGYRVFFSRITLEDKLGQKYEPYIFAALHSAKIMLAIGTSFDHYNAVWVKNEWSRYLKLMEKDKRKHLIPCYKGIDAYDMPREFARLQAQDLGKVGGLQDLLRGIDKLIAFEKSSPIAVPDSGAEEIANTVTYRSALDTARKGTVSDIQTAIVQLRSISGWKDTDAQIRVLEKQLAAQKKKITSRIALLAVIALCVAGVLIALLSSGNETETPKSLSQSITVPETTVPVTTTPPEITAAATPAPTGFLSVAAGGWISAGLDADGTAVAAGRNHYGQCDIWNWSDLIAISAGDSHTVGLRADGTVVATGRNNYGQCNVSGWENVKAISAGTYCTLGLLEDGRVVAAGSKNDEGALNVSGWTDVIAISAGETHSVALRSDGTVVAVGGNTSGQCNVSGWTDVIAISAGSAHTVGLRSDGTVLTTGSNQDGQCAAGGWTDVVSICAGDYHTVALRSDGTVLAAGWNEFGQCNVSGWSGIVAIEAGYGHTVALTADGKVAAVGRNDYGMCDVFGW